MVEKFWMETYKEMFPDFIACIQKVENKNNRISRVYIPVKEILSELKELNKKCEESDIYLWNQFAGGGFFQKIKYSQFSNVDHFTVIFNNQEIGTKKFRTLWEKTVKELFT